jgi:hypothetical protein
VLDLYKVTKSRANKYKLSLSESRERDEPYSSKLKKTMNQAFKSLSSKRSSRKDRFRSKNTVKSSLKYRTSCKKSKGKLDITRSSKSEDNRSRHSSISSSTSLVIKESAENEILEQIHTFNLKRGSVYSQVSMNKSDLSSMSGSNRRSSSTSAQRAFYISELVKIQDSELDRTMYVLNEILRQIDDFRKVRELPTEKRLSYLQQRLGEKKRLKISFSDQEEIERMRRDNQYKLNVRSALGIKNMDDWIFNLNIGNVMHMSPIGFDDLHSGLVLDSIEKRCIYELSKDSLLEKIVLLTVGYFCVGTEIRFLMNKTVDKQHPRKDSEMWHAKALHTSSVFLPSDCPLVSHVTSSYIKHHLTPKLEDRKVAHAQLITNISRVQNTVAKQVTVSPVEEADATVPDERKKDDFK